MVMMMTMNDFIFENEFNHFIALSQTVFNDFIKLYVGNCL